MTTRTGTCNKCGTAFQIPGAKTGQRMQCPQCKRGTVTVQSASGGGGGRRAGAGNYAAGRRRARGRKALKKDAGTSADAGGGRAAGSAGGDASGRGQAAAARGRERRGRRRASEKSQGTTIAIIAGALVLGLIVVGMMMGGDDGGDDRPDRGSETAGSGDDGGATAGRFPSPAGAQAALREFFTALKDGDVGRALDMIAIEEVAEAEGRGVTDMVRRDLQTALESEHMKMQIELRKFDVRGDVSSEYDQSAERAGVYHVTVWERDTARGRDNERTYDVYVVGDEYKIFFTEATLSQISVAVDGEPDEAVRTIWKKWILGGADNRDDIVNRFLWPELDALGGIEKSSEEIGGSDAKFRDAVMTAFFTEDYREKVLKADFDDLKVERVDKETAKVAGPIPAPETKESELELTLRVRAGKWKVAGSRTRLPDIAIGPTPGGDDDGDDGDGGTAREPKPNLFHDTDYDPDEDEFRLAKKLVADFKTAATIRDENEAMAGMRDLGKPVVPVLITYLQVLHQEALDGKSTAIGKGNVAHGVLQDITGNTDIPYNAMAGTRALADAARDWVTWWQAHWHEEW